jgi:endonuclease YncB( thermonuclease family)
MMRGCLGSLLRRCTCGRKRTRQTPSVGLQVSPPVTPAVAPQPREPSSWPAGLKGATLEGLKAQASKDPGTRFGLHVAFHPCKVVKVYDGDSLTLAWPRRDAFDPMMCYANCRLYGIDTPELRGGTSQEKDRARQARDVLSGVVLHQMFVFSTVGPTGLDKYGRPLVKIFPRAGLTSEETIRILGDHTSLNDWALANLPGCVSYFGGTKGEGALSV